MTWEEKNEENTPTIKAYSCSVVSLGPSHKPPPVMLTPLFLPHNKVSGKLGTHMVNPQNSDACPNTVSVGTE